MNDTKEAKVRIADFKTSLKRQQNRRSKDST